MTTNDLVNLRWQYIRSIELNQQLQDEIISLKSYVKSQEAKDSINNSEKLKQKNKIKILLNELNKKINNVKNDLNVAKKSYINDMSLTNSDFIKLKNLTKKIDNLNFSSSKKHASETQALAAKLAEAEKLAKTRLEKLAGESSKYQSELVEMKEKYQKLSNEYESRGRDITLLREDKTSLEEKLDNSRNKISQLQKAMKKLQDENSNAANISQQEYETKCRDYEHHIANLNHTNMSLEDDVNRLQNEIERLKSSMNNIPRKSEFSKYVEVKLQNANLQAQVQDLARRQTMTKKNYKEDDSNENSKRNSKLRSSNNSEESNAIQQERVIVPRTRPRPLSSVPHDTVNETLDSNSINQIDENDIIDEKLKPYPPDSPAISSSRRVGSGEKKSSRPSQYRNDIHSRDNFDESIVITNQRNTTIISKSNGENLPVDVGVPLMGKSTRESLKARSTLVHGITT